jgi:Raf kinase inhibitor-like YbhB/YbcL family protein
MAFALSDLKLRSPAFDYHTRIPSRHAGDGEDLSPPLEWSAAPDGTASFVIVCHDPDAPLVQNGRIGFVHWLLYGIPGHVRSLEEGTRIGVRGMNDFGDAGYGGPMPPEDHGTHHYYFWILALDTVLDLDPKLTLGDVLERIEPHLIGMNRLVGTYRRGD